MIQRRRHDDGHTPMMRQYLSAKEKHPDDVLFFRMGDFYEMFYEDAEVVSEELGLTLTSRSKEKGARIPMAGVPVKAAEGYIRRLLEKGHRVAICEQVEDPREAKGIVDREVVRVVTPGTFLDENALDESRPLHLCAVVQGEDVCGIAWVDLSTGSFHAGDLRGPGELQEALLRVAAVECLHPEGARDDAIPALAWLTENSPSCALTPFPEWHFDRATARERLLAHFGTRTLEGFGCEHLGPGIAAAGALIRYLEETQKQALPHISRLRTAASGRALRLDPATHRALDLLQVARTGDRHGSLLAHLDHTRTAMGARLLRDWLTAPLLDIGEIRERQAAVTACVDDRDGAGALAAALRNVRDIERLASRLPLERVNGRDLKALECSLRAVPELKATLARFEDPTLREIDATLEADRLAAIAEAIGAAVVDEPPMTVKEGGVIRDGFDPQLDELRAVSREGVDWIARFQESESDRTGIPTLKVGYNRVFGYYVEVTHTHRDKIPVDYTRKQTLKNAERYITPALKEQESRVLGARDRATDLELELFQRLRREVQEELILLQDSARSLARLDVLLALADVAVEEGYVAPELTEENVLEIGEGFHPVVAAGIERGNFTPNDVAVGDEHGSLAVITGPNMAGKSTYIRQTALIVVLAQMGSYVPAARARVGVADRVFTRVGAADDLTRGQSTFMVEMTETANILNNATDRSLVILDEVGRGTSTLDGVSIAWAIAEHLVSEIGARTLFATHYHELTELAERAPDAVRNLNVLVREWQEEIVFLHKIVAGATDKAYGIHVARLAGLPEPVLDRARDILAYFEEESRQGHGAPPVREETAKSGVQQLDLFAPPYEKLADRLRGVDIENTTPLEALEILSELRELL